MAILVWKIKTYHWLCIKYCMYKSCVYPRTNIISPKPSVLFFLQNLVWTSLGLSENDFFKNQKSVLIIYCYLIWWLSVKACINRLIIKSIVVYLATIKINFKKACWIYRYTAVSPILKGYEKDKLPKFRMIWVILIPETFLDLSVKIFRPKFYCNKVCYTYLPENKN